MRLIIQLPALNEAASIGRVLGNIPSQLPGVDEILMVVVDDGSTDGTGRIALEHGAIVVTHERSRGVGAAFRSGLARSIELCPDLIVTMDADGQFNPNDIAVLIGPIVAGEADFVSASRFKDPAFEPSMPRAKRWGNKIIARWLSHMTGQTFHDVSCGFRAYSRKAFLRLDPQGDFTYTHEVFLSLAFAGLRIREVPVNVRGVREHGQSRVAGNLLRYAWRAGTIILATYRDYRPMALFGRIAGALGVCGLAALGFLGVHWMRTGAFFPYKAVGFAGGALCGAALLVALVGFVASMLARVRSGVETALLRAGETERFLRLSADESRQQDGPAGGPGTGRPSS
jgi:glycosyltransferase involved in cell wall biosynthesis